ncbi:hypothetical protein SAMD00019534_016830 [Acytostelium subglobosum LB1]|uniref:hypothetical protein n=1 Tax=Acytostelium subglobosum LB1 TaxID=1410327 RepID=UPI000644B9E9|nr:hypothetical protein SAMD00019534_016830 [Acytostelium subglobosum LB1]GAM18508.1 hypothetical protein SAMD00019534_016830 [Acytostelium subglobosum LB1]|eukprot:XP_012757728.1 hypothetical protein SAMD00019534_016830 [Acytostelium subglobosum LB1]
MKRKTTQQKQQQPQQQQQQVQTTKKTKNTSASSAPTQTSKKQQQPKQTKDNDKNKRPKKKKRMSQSDNASEDGSSYETYDSNEEDVYEGEVDEDGERHGHGSLYTLDGFIMEGEWVHGTLNGKGSLIYEDVLIEGQYVDGELSGHCSEFTLEHVLTFEGEYVSGERNGKGVLHNIDGSRIEGVWTDSILSGECTFYYPDERFTIKGTWEDGEFVKGTAGTTISEFPINIDTNVVRDEGTSSTISTNPTLPDLFEEYYLYVKESNIPNSGEGLFAKVDIPADRLVSYYNGMRIDPKIADDRDWEFNRNTMYLDKETYIDIPPEWSTSDKYCASLGHKANHDLNNNTVYRSCYHPRFGDIKCVRSIRAIAKDEEILVNYDYEEKDKPQWYKDLESSRPEGQPAQRN